MKWQREKEQESVRCNAEQFGRRLWTVKAELSPKMNGLKFFVFVFGIVYGIPLDQNIKVFDPSHYTVSQLR